MKHLICIMGFLIIASIVFADVTAEVVSIDKDQNGNIRVWTQYKIDGVEVQSNYPKIGGKSVYCSRYNAFNFLGMTDAQIKTRILADVDAHTKSLITQTYTKKANEDILTKHLKNITGSKVSNEEAVIQIDTDGDGVNDKEIKIKTDGSSVISPVSP